MQVYLSSMYLFAMYVHGHIYLHENNLGHTKWNFIVNFHKKLSGFLCINNSGALQLRSEL